MLLVFFLACVVGIILQAVFVRGFLPTVIAPDFLLILIVAVALTHQTSLGLLGCYCIGLAGDFASGRFVGPNAAGAVMAFLTVVIVGRHLYSERLLARALLVFTASLVKTITIAILMAMHVGLESHAATARIALSEALFTAAIAPWVIRLLTFGAGTGRRSGNVSFSSGRWV